MIKKWFSDFSIINKNNIKFIYSKLISRKKERNINFIFIEKHHNTEEEKKYYSDHQEYKKLKNCISINIDEIIKNKENLFEILNKKNNVLIGYYKSISWIYRIIHDNGYNISILK